MLLLFSFLEIMANMWFFWCKGSVLWCRRSHMKWAMAFWIFSWWGIYISLSPADWEVINNIVNYITR